jgi:transcriptional regulator with XRE-family HTH domain
MSRRQAAAKAGISPSQWSDIERGHKQAGSSVTVPVLATAETLARMARIVGATADDLVAAGREDAARELRNLDRDQDQRRRLAAIPGLGAIEKQKLTSTESKDLLPLIASGLDAIDASQLTSRSKQELTALFVDNLIYDATRRNDELLLLLRIATDNARAS